jgi:hypothetical protein
MIDFNTLLNVSTMGGEALRIEGDRTTGESSVTPLLTSAAARAHAGTPEAPTMVAAMTAEVAADQHSMLDKQIADLDAQLNAQTFDPSTGTATGYKVAEGTRERELLQLQRQSKHNALQYLGHRALEQLPKRAERLGAADDALLAAAQREQNIATLAESQDSSGKAIGRAAATKLIDAAAQRALADRLVRGN